MLVVTLNGSPHTDGNTDKLLNALEVELENNQVETRRLNLFPLLNSLGKPFCDVCTAKCSGTCYSGTPVADAMDLLKKANGLVVGSPVYFGTVSAPLKAFFDRTRKLRNERGLYNAVGAAVTVAACRFGGQETTIKAIHDMMLVHGMLIVGDGHSESDCGHHGICAQQPAENDAFALDRIRLLARRMAEVTQAISSLRATPAN